MAAAPSVADTLFLYRISWLILRIDNKPRTDGSPPSSLSRLENGLCLVGICDKVRVEVDKWQG